MLIITTITYIERLRETRNTSRKRSGCQINPLVIYTFPAKLLGYLLASQLPRLPFSMAKNKSLLFYLAVMNHITIHDKARKPLSKRPDPFWLAPVRAQIRQVLHQPNASLFQASSRRCLFPV
ncbi:hypothetical protein ACRALDRAFT_211743 [Sodiomyces alcalophilus JCM 7366]|uniref:uncharacterized protein n=1 Tax=Sodiomyces alcalophilus JCM 7366 TaxID=591952 RepID=UPI0039B39614